MSHNFNASMPVQPSSFHHPSDCRFIPALAPIISSCIIYSLTLPCTSYLGSTPFTNALFVTARKLSSHSPNIRDRAILKKETKFPGDQNLLIDLTERVGDS